MTRMKNVLIGALVLIVASIAGCNPQDTAPGQPPPAPTATPTTPAVTATPAATTVPIDRGSKIPAGAIKMTPELDELTPKSESQEYHDPIPLPYPINTAGGEDSAFILPGGETLYFWFTPDVSIPPEKQLLDGVTGIYVSHKSGDSWSEPERVWLQDANKLALDGCAFVKDDVMWFCSAREGHAGVNWFTAELDPLTGTWGDWSAVDFPAEWEVGELHIHGDELYFHSYRAGGSGGLDIWVTKKDAAGNWMEPENVEAVNSERDEGFPAVSPDGQELWLYRDYSLWRSKKVYGEWTEPELMISSLAGEASIDDQGNVYFTHHFFKNDEMIEADIYLAYKKR